MPLASEGILSSWSTPGTPCAEMSPAAGNQAKSGITFRAGSLGSWSLLMQQGHPQKCQGNMSPAAMTMPVDWNIHGVVEDHCSV